MLRKLKSHWKKLAVMKSGLQLSPGICGVSPGGLGQVAPGLWPEEIHGKCRHGQQATASHRPTEPATSFYGPSLVWPCVCERLSPKAPVSHEQSIGRQKRGMIKQQQTVPSNNRIYGFFICRLFPTVKKLSLSLNSQIRFPVFPSRCPPGARLQKPTPLP